MMLIASPRRDVLDKLSRERLGLIETAGLGRGVSHAERGVEHDDPMRPLTRDHGSEHSRNGLAMAETTRRITSVLIARSSHCSIRIRRRFLRRAASRNCIAAHETSRNLRRFKRWITIGTDAAARP